MGITAFFGFQQVQLLFDKFGLEDSSSCKFDRLVIYDGSDDTAPVIRTLCGSSLPGPVTASGNVVFVAFMSDGSVTGSGFRIIYRAALGGIDNYGKSNIRLINKHCVS